MGVHGGAGTSEPPRGTEFSVVREDRPDAAIIHLIGELDVSTQPILREELQRATDSGTDEVVLDLGDLLFIDSSGVESIAVAHVRLVQAGKRLVVANARGGVRKVFQLSGLDQRLPMR